MVGDRDAAALSRRGDHRPTYDGSDNARILSIGWLVETEAVWR